MQRGACPRAAWEAAVLHNTSRLFACFMKTRCFWLGALALGSALILKETNLSLVSLSCSSAMSSSEGFSCSKCNWWHVPKCC